MKILAGFDPEISKLIDLELHRQQNKLELIASENFVSQAVMEAQGSVLTNKYAEGYPGKRYYGGCEHVDGVEQLAIDRVKAIFGAEHANVQPHSGAQANTAVYFAFLKPGDTILGMNLAHGGHLTHGSPVNVSGKCFNIVPYGVDEVTHRINYDEVAELARKHQPKMIVAGASAYPRIIDFERMGQIAREVGALFMVDMAHIAGLVAAGVHPTPIGHADIVTTTTHKTLRGPRGGVIMCRAELAPIVDKGVFPGMQGGPLMHVIAAKAVSFKEALTDEFRAYQEQIVKNASALAKRLMKHGFTLVSGGTDNHLILVDLRPQNITGKDAEKLLDKIGVTVNKNAIPFDPASPFVTSGIRIGTAALSSRGMQEVDMEIVGDIIDETDDIAMVLNNPTDIATQEEAAILIADLCTKHPLYA